MLLIAKILTNVTFVGHDQPVRHQTRIRINHTCNLIKACKSIKSHQRNTPVEYWDRVKSRKLNKHPKKGAMIIFY